jgi:hypothetical protein
LSRTLRQGGRRKSKPGFDSKPCHPDRSDFLNHVIPTEAKRSGGTLCSAESRRLTWRAALAFTGSKSHLTKQRLPHPCRVRCDRVGGENLNPDSISKRCHPDRSEAQWRDLVFCPTPQINMAGSPSFQGSRSHLTKQRLPHPCRVRCDRVGGENLNPDSIPNDVIPTEAKRSGGTLRSA